MPSGVSPLSRFQVEPLKEALGITRCDHSKPNISSTPRCGSGPKYRWRALPLHPPWDPSPHTRLGRPVPDSRSIAKRAKGVGGRGGRGRGGKGFGLREGSSNCNGAWGGDPPNTSWGRSPPDPHLGAPKYTA